MKGVKVTAEDLDTGETETKVVEEGDYNIIVVAPAYIDGVQTYANGTHVITVKGRTAA